MMAYIDKNSAEGASAESPSVGSAGGHLFLVRRARDVTVNANLNLWRLIDNPAGRDLTLDLRSPVLAGNPVRPVPVANRAAGTQGDIGVVSSPVTILQVMELQ